MRNKFRLMAGVDVAAKSASIAISKTQDDKPKTLDIEQNLEGFTKFHNRLNRYAATASDTLIVMEATGSYWMNLARFLYDYGYAVSVVNPATAAYFARMNLKRDKTDALDAITLLDMGWLMPEKLPRWQAPPAIYEELYQRLTQRDNLVKMRVRNNNRDHAREQRIATIELVEQRVLDLSALIEQHIEDLDSEIHNLLLADHEWAQSARFLMSITGIKAITTGWIQVATLNFQTFDTPEQAASFAGLVPRQRQSGTSLNGQAKIGFSGHPRLRQAMFTAAMSAATYNAPIKRLNQRLKAKGMSNKAAMIAAARKLLHISWACVKHERYFDPDF